LPLPEFHNCTAPTLQDRIDLPLCPVFPSGQLFFALLEHTLPSQLSGACSGRTISNFASLLNEQYRVFETTFELIELDLRGDTKSNFPASHNFPMYVQVSRR
jgi:hypothetical protein